MTFMSKVPDVLLDTNIIVYSSNTLSPKYEQASQFRERVRLGEMRAFISHQNILESVRVLTHPKYENPMSTQEVLAQIASFKQLCYVISPYSETEEIAISLIKKHGLGSNQVFDAYLTATMLSNGLSIIATDNEIHFKKFKEIKIINPFNPH